MLSVVGAVIPEVLDPDYPPSLSRQPSSSIPISEVALKDTKRETRAVESRACCGPLAIKSCVQ